MPTLSVTRQAALLGISRGSVYYLQRQVSDADLALMRRIDELHLEHPFMGARMLRRQLLQTGVQVGRRHISTLMRRMGIEALAPQPGTANARWETRFTPICCASLPSSDPTRYGRWTPPTFRWRVGSCTSPP